MRLSSILLMLMLTNCTMGMKDRTTHAGIFVDHLNNMPIGKTNYLLWH